MIINMKKVKRILYSFMIIYIVSSASVTMVFSEELNSIASVSAVNGVVSVSMTESIEPAIDDFIVKQVINNSTPIVLEASLVSWDQTSKIVRLLVPNIYAEETQQSVVYHVQYQNGPITESTAFNVLDGIPIVKNGLAEAVVIFPQPVDMEIPGWHPPKNSTVSGKIKVVNSRKYSGKYSVKISDESNSQSYGLESKLIGISAGESYTASVMVYRESGSIPVIMMYFYDSVKKLINYYPYGYGGNIGEWAKITVTGTTPANAVYASIVLYSSISDVQNTCFDDVTLKKSNGELITIENSGFENNAADILADYVKKSSGIDLPAVFLEDFQQNGGFEDYVCIFVGGSVPTGDTEIDGALQDLADDGFVIQTEDSKITIIGLTPLGTEFGVYEFLERYIGVNWLMPGPDGVHVPQRSAINITEELISEEPAMISRHFFGVQHPVFTEWARFNRMFDNIQFHHNLYRLFDPAVFYNHPEYYPGGVVPLSGSEDWNPAMNSDTAEAAIERIKEFFRENPEASSYSLGVNDVRIHVESDPNHPNYPGDNHINSVGLLNMSDIYYPWVNNIVEGVLEEFPDKYFGLLAYAQVYDPPMNSDGTPYILNSHIIPYITDDRVSWLDSDVNGVAQEHIEKWKDSATNLGFYEYLFGSPYQVPRVYPTKMAENYIYAEENDVIGHAAELYPNFGEGPKPWLSAKLQWDSDQDVEVLLAEWYAETAGIAAAPYLKKYFEHWEDFWARRVFESDWYKTWKSSVPRKNYLPLYTHNYLVLVTEEELEACRELLENALLLVETDEQYVRVNSLLKSFEYYEASALSYPGSEFIASPLNESEALGMIAKLRQSIEMGRKRLQLYDEYRIDPISIILPNQTQYIEYWNGVQKELMNALLSYIEDGYDINATIKTELYEIMLDYPELYRLPIPEWSIKNTTYGGKVKTVYSRKYSGSYSVQINDDSSSQSYALESSLVGISAGEAYTSSTWVYRESGSIPIIMMYFYDSSHNLINHYPYASGGNLGEWTKISVTGTAPANASYVSIVLYSSISDTQKVYFDDITLKKSNGDSLLVGNEGFEKVLRESPATIYSAVNGTIVIILPDSLEPNADDFTVEQVINGGTPTPVRVSMAGWNSTFTFATLAIPPVLSSEIEQSVIYRVRYKYGPEVGSATFAVPRLPIDSEISGWVPINSSAGKVKAVNSNKCSGNYSVKIYDDSNSQSYGLKSNLIGVSAGVSLTASAMVYRESGSIPVIMMYFYDSSHNLINHYPYGFGGNIGEWSKISVSGTAPTNAAYVSVVLYSSISDVQTIYFDNITVKKPNGDSLTIGNAGFEEI